MLAERRYGVGERLEKFVAETVQHNLPVIEAQIAKALVDALQSPEFMGLLRTEMLTACCR